jgi:hypothetical protein
VARENPRADQRESDQPEPKEIELGSVGEVTVVPQETFPKPAMPRKIHPRRPLPAVPEGLD